MDFTDADHPKEIAYFDRDSIDPPPGADVPVAPTAEGPGGRAMRGTIGGSSGASYWNRVSYSSELDRGFDAFAASTSRLVAHSLNPQSLKLTARTKKP